MKQLALLLCLLLSLALLTSCESTLLAGPSRLIEESSTDLTGISSTLAARDTTTRTDDRVCALFYRYGSEAFLAPEFHLITRTSSQSFETALIQSWITGPLSGELQPLLPPGVRLLSTSMQGRTLFVTFSRDIMSSYLDEPVDWQEHDFWRAESPLRRTLCMEGLVATITENCDVDQVQVLVDRTSLGSLRLQQNYFLDDSEDDVLTGPMTRTSEHLLTSERAMERILDLWMLQDWERLYTCILSRDPNNGMDRPLYADFVARMESLPVLTGANLSEASMSLDGSTATFSADTHMILSGGIAMDAEGRIFRLTRDQGIWKISLDHLTSWMEVFLP